MKQKTFFTYSWHVDEDEEDYTSIRIYGLDENNKNVCVRVDDFTPYAYIELPKNIVWTDGYIRLLSDKIIEIMGENAPIKIKLTKKYPLYGVFMDKNNRRRLFPYLLLTFYHRNDCQKLYYKLRKRLTVSGIGTIKLKVHETNADPLLQLTCCANIPTAGWVKFEGTEVKEDDKLTLCDFEYEVKWKKLEPFDSEIVPKPKIMGFDIEVNSSDPKSFPKADRPGDKVFQISCILSRYGDKVEKYSKHILTLGDPDQNKIGKDVIIHTYNTEANLLLGFTELIRTENPNILSGYNILGFDIDFMIQRSKLNMCFDFDMQGFHKYNHSKEKIIKWSSSAYKDQEFHFIDAEGRVFVDLYPLVKRDFRLSNYKLKTISELFIGKTKDPLTHKDIFRCYKIGIKKNRDGKYSRKARLAMALVGKYCVQDSVLVVQLMEKLQTWIGLTEMAKTCNVEIFSLYTKGQQLKVFSQIYKYCTYNNYIVERDGYTVKDDERYVGAHVFAPKPGVYYNVVPFDFASLYPTIIIAYNICYSTYVPNDSNIPDSMCNVMEWEDHINCIHDPKIIRKMELTNYIKKEEEKMKKIRKSRDETKKQVSEQKKLLKGFKKTGDHNGIYSTEKEIKKLEKKIKRCKKRIEEIKEELKPYRNERANLNKTKGVVNCAKRYYRFLKEPKGVLPTVIQNLLDARKHTRKVDMKNVKNKISELKKEEELKNVDFRELIEQLETKLNVLNKRQLSYKVSANSMYGATGVRRGQLPFMPAAMVVTYKGRINIELVAKKIVEDFKGVLIYGDTDSNYINFPHMKGKTNRELWEYAEYVADEITKLFPPPMKLEFEEEIYKFFLILSKKRYMYRAVKGPDEKMSKKIGKKGVLLTRRDNCKFVRDIYAGVTERIADNIPRDDIIYWILSEMNSMCANNKPPSDFVITKSVGDVGNLDAIPFVNEKGEKKAKIGNYTVPILSKNPEERKEQLIKSKTSTPKEFYINRLPAQVQLAERMKRRGERVSAGSRLEYIVTNPDDQKAKQSVKIEDLTYFLKHRRSIKIDYYYYLKSLVNPLDQLLDVVFGETKNWKKEFTDWQYKYRLKIRKKMLEELKSIFSPKIIIK